MCVWSLWIKGQSLLVQIAYDLSNVAGTHRCQLPFALRAAHFVCIWQIWRLGNEQFVRSRHLIYSSGSRARRTNQIRLSNWIMSVRMRIYGQQWLGRDNDSVIAISPKGPRCERCIGAYFRSNGLCLSSNRIVAIGIMLLDMRWLVYMAPV